MVQPMPSKMIAPMSTVRLMLAACLAVAAPMTSGGIAFAADGPEAEPVAAAQPSPPRNRPDFLFGQPRGLLGFSGGWLQASGGGILGSFRDYLTIDEGAYDTPLVRFVAGISLTPRVDLVFDVAPSQSRTVSEYRFWDEGGLPISQSTKIRQIPVNAGVRYWVLPRGRRIGRLAWVPNAAALHVGGGVGLRWYRLGQAGDFVDEAFASIHGDRLQSGGWTPSRHVSAGASIRMTRRLYAVAEIRRVWSGTELAGDFIGDIDLNGLHMTGGIEFVF